MYSLDYPQVRVYFSVNSDTPRAELWVRDGTVAGTKMVTKLGAPNATIDQFVVAGENLYIFTSQSDNGPEILYRSNGTAKGTVALHSFANTDVVSASGLPNGNLAFDFSALALPLWVSNGTVAGTTLLHDMSGGFGYLGDGDGAITPINGLFYLQGKDSKGGGGASVVGVNVTLGAFQFEMNKFDTACKCPTQNSG
jgi:ELWxxDGT repeat protein